MSLLPKFRMSQAGNLLACGLTVLMVTVSQSVDAGVIYRCQSASGVIEYSNSPPAASRDCKKIDLPKITTIPAPARVTAKARTGEDAKFPSVAAQKQRKRDTDRARILRDELRREEKRLAELRKTFKDGQPDRLGNERNYQKYLDRVEVMKSDISRSEGNVKALRRELAAIKP